MNGLIEKSVPLSYASLRGEEEYEVRGYVEADSDVQVW